MPGQGERERDGKHVRNDNEPAALYLPRRIYSRFSPPPFLLSSLHSAFCSTAAKSIDPAGHARPVAAPHSHQGGRGRGIHRSGNFRNKRKEQRRVSLSPRPRLLFVTCRVSSIRCLFFPPPPWTAWLPSPEFRVLFFNAKGISTKREGSVNRYGYEKARGGIFFSRASFRASHFSITRSSSRSTHQETPRDATHANCRLCSIDSAIIPLPIAISYRRGEERSLDRIVRPEQSDTSAISSRIRKEREESYYYYYYYYSWLASRVGVKVEIKRKGYTITRRRHGTDANAPRIYYCGN